MGGGKDIGGWGFGCGEGRTGSEGDGGEDEDEDGNVWIVVAEMGEGVSVICFPGHGEDQGFAVGNRV